MTTTDQRPNMVGHLTWQLIGPDGSVKATGVSENIITQVGDQVYSERGAGVAGGLAAPTGMKMGTGSVTGGSTPAYTGAGAAITTHLSGSHKAFDATYPQSSLSGADRLITFQVTYPAGTATTASPITEAVIVNDALANAGSLVANTIARTALTPPIPSKAAGDVVILIWVHQQTGS